MFFKLKEFVLSKVHEPTFIGLVFNPFYLARTALWCSIREYSFYLEGRLLDVGCGTKPYAKLLNVTSYIGLDLDNERCRNLGFADDFYDGTVFPYKNESFDSVLCNQVLEHIFFPDSFIVELARVIKPGGRMLITVPFIWDEHEQPNDYARYTTYGLKSILERNGFRVIEQRRLLADPSIFCQLFNAYVFKKWRSNIFIWNIIITICVIFPLNICGRWLFRLLPDNPDMFLDQVIVAERILEIVTIE